MEMEGIQCHTYVWQVYFLYYIVCSLELVDGAGGHTAEFQRYADIRTHFLSNIAQSFCCFFLDFFHALVQSHIEGRHCDKHFHADCFADFFNPVQMPVHSQCLEGVKLIKKFQSVVSPWFDVVILEPFAQLFQGVAFLNVFCDAVVTDFKIVKSVLFTHFQVCHQ